MSTWLGILAIVVAAAVFIAGPDNSSVNGRRWVLLVGEVALLVLQPASHISRKWSPGDGGANRASASPERPT